MRGNTPDIYCLFALAAMAADDLHRASVRPAPIMRVGKYRKVAKAKTHGDQSARVKFRKVKRRRDRVGK